MESRHELPMAVDFRRSAAYARRCISNGPNVNVAWWLMASYAYYELDDPIISDAMFDAITARLKEIGLDNLTHIHRHLITQGMLDAGTGNGIKWPSRVISSARQILNMFSK